MHEKTSGARRLIERIIDLAHPPGVIKELPKRIDLRRKLERMTPAQLRKESRRLEN